MLMMRWHPKCITNQLHQLLIARDLITQFAHVTCTVQVEVPMRKSVPPIHALVAPCIAIKTQTDIGKQLICFVGEPRIRVDDNGGVFASGRADSLMTHILKKSREVRFVCIPNHN